MLRIIYGQPSTFRIRDKIDKLDCRHRRIESFVAGLRAGAIDGLFEIVCRHYSKSYGEVCFKRNLGDTFEHFRGDVLVVRSLSANHDAETNHRIVFVAERRAFGRHR